MKYEVGQAAYIDNGRYGRQSVISGVVSKITSSGQITVDIGGDNKRQMRFTSAGREIGSSSSWNLARLISEKDYDDGKASIVEELRRQKVKQLVSEFSQERINADNKAELLAKLEAVKAAIEGL